MNSLNTNIIATKADLELADHNQTEMLEGKHDSMIAELIIKEHGENIVFDNSKKQWRVFSNGAWIGAEDARRMLIAFHKEIISNIADYKYPHLNIVDEKWLTSAMNTSKIAAVRKIVEEEKALSMDKLDADHNLIGIQDRVYDIAEGSSRPALASDLVMKSLGTSFDPDAKCPKWESFLKTAMQGDQEMINYLQCLVGYFLTASTQEQEIYYLYGTGANGKSTFLDLVKTLLGNYGVKLSSDSFMKKRSGTLNLGAQASLAMLAGARLAITDETGENATFDAQMLKSISGDDEVTGRFLRSNPITFKSTTKVVMYGNDKPHANMNDEGFWRRFRYIKFEHVVPKADRNPNLLAELKNELPGILNWALKGLSEWQENGLQTPQKILKDGNDYRESQDTVSDFLKRNTQEKLGSRLPIKQLFDRYNEWCETNLKPAESKQGFSKRARWYFETYMKGKVKDFRTNKDRGYEGVQLC
ncbi:MULTISPECIES: phage/plasmid primase, P4 family [unclassified Marinobacterium]|jgi:putative DNA primase/helicase|uniref:DNA primase family protein n=1 Tax=unclassified Marinobacterium TaxID=2644139 RepID=UPI001568D3FB|nr:MULTISPECIES: phage/plasmid primase, P4 family [unclassified Marinobacterium]NRP10609.1 hypothetical protein [Marinobacterium sp. xm-g-48]NRP14798.1 hypothetical protein [Marinobacterium sp. xm-a-152]NRP58053.1 hypothetical protein [Marinobacterium sp. xm-d-510]NRP98284.1 hypothetical protein [Marinobacterium sp. xm-a-127]